MAGPTAAVMTASTTSAAAIPWKVDRHSRVRPVARTMVSASTASTTQATKTVRINGRAFTGSPGLSLREKTVQYGGDDRTGPGRAGRGGRRTGAGLAAADLPGAAGADPAAGGGVAPGEVARRDLPAELGGGGAGLDSERAG